jgi:hypothetical protein
MGLLRSMRLFHGKAQKNREETAAELPKLPQLPEEPSETIKAQPKAALREPKYEARPDPDKPGWGLTMGQEIFKVREDRTSHE